MNNGDIITIPNGKEKDPKHSGIPMVIDAINGDDYSLKMPDGNIVHYSKSDLTLPDEPVAKFKAPETLEVVIDHKQKQQEGPTPFSFSKPQDIQKDIAKPTKSDVQQKQPTVEEIKSHILKEETPKPNSEYSDYYDNAEMLIDGWSLALSSICNAVAGDTAIQSYDYHKDTADKLKRQLTKILIKRNTMLPIEVLFAGTLIGATSPIVLKTRNRRKELNEIKRIAKELELSKSPEQKLEEKKASLRRKPGGQKKS